MRRDRPNTGDPADALDVTTGPLRPNAMFGLTADEIAQYQGLEATVERGEIDVVQLYRGISRIFNAEQQVNDRFVWRGLL
jgi:hypothetical protein